MENEPTRAIRIIAGVANASGDAELIPVVVVATHADIEDGNHFTMALFALQDARYETRGENTFMADEDEMPGFNDIWPILTAITTPLTD